MESVSGRPIRVRATSFVMWGLLPGLLYFATSGHYLSSVSIIPGNYEESVDAAATAKGHLALALIWLIIAIVASPYVKQIARGCMRNKMVLLLPVLAILSTTWSEKPQDSLRHGCLILLSTLFAIFLINRFTSQQLLRLFNLIGVTAAISSIFCIAFAPQYGIGADLAWKGIFGHKNDLGVFMVFLAMPAVFTNPKSSAGKIARLLYLFLIITLVALSQSRSGWFVALVAITFSILLLIMERTKGLRRLTFLALTAGLTCASMYAISVNFGSIMQAIGKDPTISSRTDIWKAVLESIAKRPILGYGYSGFWNGLNGPSEEVITKIGFGISHAHCGYLNVWLQIGLVGLSIILFMLAKALLDALRIDKFNAATRCWTSFVVLTVAANIDESYLFNHTDLLWIFFVVACIKLAQEPKGRPKHAKVVHLAPYVPLSQSHASVHSMI
jgi:exopolysaccharide production protein ExoQ